MKEKGWIGIMVVAMFLIVVGLVQLIRPIPALNHPHVFLLACFAILFLAKIKLYYLGR